MPLHRLAALALAATLFSVVSDPAAADSACRDASFCPDLQLVRSCQATSCERADRNRALGQREERIVDEGLDGPDSSQACMRLAVARRFYTDAVADGDSAALADRDRARGKLKQRGCSSVYW
jgi:hypothetical protein